MENGVLIWCDDQGVGIKAKELDKTKHSGKAFLKVVGVNRLPTVYELTGDSSWVVGGELYQFYNLELDSGDELLSAESGVDGDLNTYDDSEEVENSGDEDDSETGVKVLDKKSYNEAIKKEKEARLEEVQEDGDFDESEIQELFEEFSDILKPYVPQEMNVA